MSVDPHLEKFNIVSNDYGRTWKFDFCNSLGKNNFTDHHTPDTINGFRDSILICKMQDCYCTLRKNFLLIRPYHQIKRCKPLQWLDYMKTNHFKMLLKVFSTRYTYLNCSLSITLLPKNNLTNICSKISKIGMNEFLNGLYL